MASRLHQGLEPKPAGRGARSTQRILDAAARLFGRDGFRGASMQQVADEAGVSKGLLHYHFTSKEHLLLEAITATFRQVYGHVQGRLQQGDRGLAAALRTLDALYGALRDLRAWAPFMVETISLGHAEGPVRQDLDAFYAELTGMMETGIREVFAAEADRLAVPPDRLALLVRIAMHGLIVELAKARNEEDLSRVDRLYQDLRLLFERMALSGPPATPPPREEVL